MFTEKEKAEDRVRKVKKKIPANPSKQILMNISKKLQVPRFFLVSTKTC